MRERVPPRRPMSRIVDWSIFPKNGPEVESRTVARRNRDERREAHFPRTHVDAAAAIDRSRAAR
jgi:hypothetical protein